MSWKAMAVLTVIVAALLSYGVYYTQGMSTEEYTVATLCTYEQNIRCDYIAYLRPNILYGETVGEGETIYLSLVNRIDVTFYYTFECSETGIITAEYGISSLVADPSEAGWSKSIDELVSVEKLETNTTTSAALEAKFSYNVTEIRELINRIEEDIGVTSSTYQIITTINVNTTDETSVGTVSKPIEESVVLKLNYMGGYIGDYMERGGVIEVEAPEKHLPGSITENFTKEITFAVQFRIAMFVALAVWIAVASLFTAWRYKVGKAEFETLPELERIMRRFEVIESRDMPKVKVQTLGSMEALKKVADDYDSILFHTKLDGDDVFFTTIENITYQYTVINEKARARMVEAQKMEQEKPIGRREKSKLKRVECPYLNSKGKRCGKIAFGHTESSAYKKLEAHVAKEHPDKLKEFKDEIKDKKRLDY